MQLSSATCRGFGLGGAAGIAGPYRWAPESDAPEWIASAEDGGPAVATALLTRIANAGDNDASVTNQRLHAR